MDYLKLRLLLLILVSLLFLTACSEEVPPPTETVRAIRTITVSEPASGKARRFSGIVEAATTSNLSFEVPGNVKSVAVDVGQRVSAGQVLAVLDDKPYQLNVDAAQAMVGRAQVEVDDARRESERLEAINARGTGLVSVQMLDQARAAYNTARKNVIYNISRLNLAKRDLDRTTLRAPFDGIITDRYVDSFQEVNRGQTLFSLHVEGAMDAAISIPESDIHNIYLGLPGDIRFPAIPGQVFRGIVSEISKAAGVANAFPIKLTIDQKAPRIRPGLTTEVTLMLGDPEEMSYLVPLSALAGGPGASENENFVFVYNADSSTVSRTLIQHGSIRDNNMIVNKGLKAGDIVAAAGVSFLQDGQQVRLMKQ